MGSGPPDISGLVSLKVDGLGEGVGREALRSAVPDSLRSKVGDVHIPRSKRGFGFIRFHSRSAAEDARASMQGAVLHGQELDVNFAEKPRPDDQLPGLRGDNDHHPDGDKPRRRSPPAPRQRRDLNEKSAPNRAPSPPPARSSRSPRRDEPERSSRRSRSRRSMPPPRDKSDDYQSAPDRDNRERERERERSRGRSRSRPAEERRGRSKPRDDDGHTRRRSRRSPPTRDR